MSSLGSRVGKFKLSSLSDYHCKHGSLWDFDRGFFVCFFNCCFAFKVLTGMVNARGFPYFYLQKIQLNKDYLRRNGSVEV